MRGPGGVICVVAFELGGVAKTGSGKTLAFLLPGFVKLRHLRPICVRLRLDLMYLDVLCQEAQESSGS